MFPDAPTERGTKHILELIDVKNKGMGAGVLFLIQLNGVKNLHHTIKWIRILEKL